MKQEQITKDLSKLVLLKNRSK